MSTSTCGGVIVDDRVLLTAAHCVLNATDVFVSVGEHLLSDDNDQTTLTVTSFNIHVHSEADIAVLILNDPLDFNRGDVRPICMNSASVFVSGESAQVAGWGLTQKEPDLVFTDALQEADVEIADSSTCEGVINSDPDAMICAVSSNSASLCDGDGGIPLTRGNADGKAELIAIASSLTQNCGSSSAMGAFTRIAPFRPWIAEVSVSASGSCI